MRPEVSVVIPCRNEAKTLAACLDALDQQDLPRSRFEILVVDGRSTDGCREMLRARGVAMLDDPGRGPAAARNVGILAARGRIVAFTDADCIPRFDWLSQLLAAFARAPDAGGVAGPLRLPRDTLLGRLEDNDARQRYRGYITSNVAYRREALLEVGGFDEELSCAEDYDLAWRIMDAGYRILHDDGPVVLHDPPEIGGAVAGYLRKQFWYARNDVPAHARAISRAARSSEARAGSGAAILGSMNALGNAGWVGLLAYSVARGRPRAAAAAGAGLALQSARVVARSAAGVAGASRDLPGMIVVQAAKTLARGAGTLVGLADLASPSGWRHLTARAAVGLARATRTSRSAPALP